MYQDLSQDSNSSEHTLVELPEDVEDLVLARLSIPALYKVRPVCKRWHSLLTSLSFLNIRDEIQGEQDASFFPLVFWNDSKPALKKDHAESGLESSVDMEPTLPEEAAVLKSGCKTAVWSWLGYDSSKQTWQAMKPFATPIEVKQVITGSNGLLCLRAQTSLLVVNPMTGTQRQVPFEENIAQLLVDRERNSFKIISVSSKKRTKVYDSQTGEWSKKGRPPPHLSVSKHIGAYRDGILFCVAREERSNQWGVIQYTVQGARTWSSLTFFPAQVAETCVKAKVVHFGGEILTLIEQDISTGDADSSSRTKRLALWKLVRATSKWQLAGEVPTEALQHLENLEDFDCVALRNQVCILNKSTFKALVGVMSKGIVTSWQPLPLEPHLPADTSVVQRCIVQFAFQPSLLISV